MKGPGIRTFLRRGDRTVLVTYPGLRLGNYLYFALHANSEQQRGRDYRVVDSGLDPVWRTVFPSIESLVVDVDDVRFRDRREHIPACFYQAYGHDFSHAELEAFIRAYLLPHVSVPDAPRTADGGAVTVNVRRGDYYSDPGFRQNFGFDLETYLAQALSEVEAARPITAITVVSDEPEWCVRALGEVMAGRPWEIRPQPAGDPVQDFLTVARSARLVITNSTFSYWAAYVSKVLHGDRQLGVWAPDFHSRAMNGGRPWQHDPGWHAVDVATSPL